MADVEDSGAEREEKQNISANLNNELTPNEQSTTLESSLNVRHSTPGDFLVSGKRFGVADFESLGGNNPSEVLQDFDPLSPTEETSKPPQSSGISNSTLSVKEDKSLSRHSAPGLLYGSQDSGATGFGASNFVYSSDNLLASNENVDQRDFEHNQFDDDLERTSKKELDQMNNLGGQSKRPKRHEDEDDAPIYPSLSLSNDFHNVARYRILSVSGSDKSGRLAIVFSAARIPSLHLIDHHQLFLYIKHTLDQYVESDYTIVYFHYGLTSKNKPSYRWLLQVYRELDRKYRKNVKALFIVHPSNIIKLIWGLFRKVISTKFAKKVTYVNCLEELSEHIHLNQLDIPNEVKEHDAQVLTRYKPKLSGSSVFHTSIPEIPKTKQFGVSLSWIKENEGDFIPRCVKVSVEFLTENGLDVEGIFRRSANSALVKRVAEMFDRGQPVDYSELGDIHCAAAIIKKFLRELPEPLLTFELCDIICAITAIPDHGEKLKRTWSVLHNQLPEGNFELLKYIMVFLKEVQKHELTKMTASNLAIVFGPNLVWGKDQTTSLAAMAQINTFTCLMLENVNYLFGHANR